jgi:hypothetical protein
MARWEPVYPQHSDGNDIPEERHTCRTKATHHPKAVARHRHPGVHQKLETQTNPVGLRRSAKPPAENSHPAREPKHVQSSTSVRHEHNTNVPTAAAEGKLTHQFSTRHKTPVSPTSRRELTVPDIAFLAKEHIHRKPSNPPIRRISTQQPERKAQAKLELAKKRRKELQNLTTETAISSAPGPELQANSVPRDDLAMPVPVLPYTWKYTSSGGPSSLEMALEAAASELDKSNLPLSDLSDLQEDGTRNKSKPSTGKPSFQGQNMDISPMSRRGHETPEHTTLSQDLDEAEPAQSPRPPRATQTEPKDAPIPTPASRSKSKVDDNRKVDDRDVLRGLHIAISAACDEEVDAWICQETGVQIRRFLADLKEFETLGQRERPAVPHEDGARARRAQLRKLKTQIRKSRLAMKGDDAPPER